VLTQHSLKRTGNLKRLMGVIVISLSVAAVLYQFAESKKGGVYQTIGKQLAVMIDASKVVLISSPSSCGMASSNIIPQAPAELFVEYLKTNHLKAKPESLTVLSEHYQVLSSQQSLAFFRGDYEPQELENRQLILLSLIGFDKTRQHALICIRSKEMADLVYLQKGKQGWAISQWVPIWLR